MPRRQVEYYVIRPSQSPERRSPRCLLNGTVLANPTNLELAGAAGAAHNDPDLGRLVRFNEQRKDDLELAIAAGARRRGRRGPERRRRNLLLD